MWCHHVWERGPAPGQISGSECSEWRLFVASLGWLTLFLLVRLLLAPMTPHPWLMGHVPFGPLAASSTPPKVPILVSFFLGLGSMIKGSHLKYSILILRWYRFKWEDISHDSLRMVTGCENITWDRGACYLPNPNQSILRVDIEQFFFLFTVKCLSSRNGLITK